MKQIKSLMNKSNRALEAAKVLLDSQFFEKSITCSYYAMFYAAEAVLLTKDIKFSSHKGVISSFGENFIKTNIFDTKLGKYLSKAFSSRLKSDYSYEEETDERAAQEIYSNAMEFMEAIKAYLIEQKFLESG